MTFLFFIFKLLVEKHIQSLSMGNILTLRIRLKQPLLSTSDDRNRQHYRCMVKIWHFRPKRVAIFSIYENDTNDLIRPKMSKFYRTSVVLPISTIRSWKWKLLQHNSECVRGFSSFIRQRRHNSNGIGGAILHHPDWRMAFSQATIETEANITGTVVFLVAHMHILHYTRNFRLCDPKRILIWG